MKTHFEMLAAYNRWANGQVYAAAEVLEDAEFRRPTGAFFGSLLATLNHLLVADKVWMRRFTGSGDSPTSLDIILHDNFAGLLAARNMEDERISGFIACLTPEALQATFSYTPITNPQPVRQRLGSALAHFFNHQTHHRGQSHAILTSLGKPSLTLDLVYFLRTPAGNAWL